MEWIVLITLNAEDGGKSSIKVVKEQPVNFRFDSLDQLRQRSGSAEAKTFPLYYEGEYDRVDGLIRTIDKDFLSTTPPHLLWLISLANDIVLFTMLAYMMLVNRCALHGTLSYM